jgi:hypothetical protein
MTSQLGYPCLAVKHETIVRLLDAAGPEQLRAIARLALRLSGYAASRITDGPYDGGTDLVVQNAFGDLLPLAVAVSVEKDWQKKLRKDVEVVGRKLGAQHVLFISSRRIPEGSFRTVQTELRDTSGVHVDRLDQQGIADLVMDHGALAELLGILDIPIDTEHLPTRPADRRRDATYAYAFFAPEVHSFHKAVRDRSLLVALAQAGGSARIDELCVDASRLLGMDVSDAMSLIHDLDRLRGQGRVLGRNGVVALTDDERVTMNALRALRQREEDGLREELRAHVDAVGLGSPDEVLELLMGGVGALVARHIGAPQALEDLHAHVRRLRRELQAHGLPEGDRGDLFVEQAIELARRSELGQSLAIGSVYQALTRLDRGALLRALDARSITFVLDASVAMPMFCALFHGSVEQRFFIVAEELHRRSQGAGIGLQLPEVWLEEMASHLLNAREYVALVSDEDLRQSRNAYVAYFAAARRAGGSADFATFLAEFGLTEALGRRAGVDRVGARRELETFLRRQLVHYGVTVVPTPADQRHLDRAAKDWAWACHLLDIDDRAPILADHDRRVLGWLSATTEHDPTHAPLIITWDRVLRRARPESAPGGALDPLATTELLSFMVGVREPAMTARFASLQLMEVEAERGSAILDALINIEHERLSDAALSRKAREFKQAYLRDQEIQSSVAALGRAWRAFQSEA